jgi:hypothetical protein
VGKVRYISDGKIYFVRVTVVLSDGRTLTTIADTIIADIDYNWHVFQNKANTKWGSKMDSFQIVQLSKYDPEVKKYIKENNIHLPSNSPKKESRSHDQLALPPEVEKEIKRRAPKHKWQPGKYRS